MSSPNPPFDLHVEIFVNGGWVDISGDVYKRTPIQITRGATSERSKPQAATCTMLLDDRNGNYSPRNPNGIYYSQLKQTMPVRVSVVSSGTNYRFWGETATLTPSADISGQDKTSTLTAGGILRRLGQGGQVVKSRPRSYIPTTNPYAYWALEDSGPLVKSGVQAVTGNGNLLHMGTLQQGWGKGALAPWLPNGLQGIVGNALFNDGRFIGLLNPTSSSTGYAIMFVTNGRADFSVEISHSQDPNSTDNWSLLISPSITSLSVVPPAGSTPAGPITIDLGNMFHFVYFQVIENFVGDSNYFVFVDGVAVTSGHITGTPPEPVVAPINVQVNLSDNQPASSYSTRPIIGHLAFYANQTPPDVNAATLAMYGSPGELVADRLTRICAENSITLVITGTTTITKPCGPQYAIGIVDLLQETADVGGGMLYETMNALGLGYITRDALYNATVALPLNYSVNHHLGAPLAPVDDDQSLRNDVTVTQKSGSAQEYIKTTGSLGTAAIGKYTDSVTLNTLTDAQTLDQAAWRAHIGTYATSRFPQLVFNMGVLPLTQRAQLLACNPGSRVTISNVPLRYSERDLDLLVIGVKESLTRYEWTITLICVPYGPYRVAVLDDATFGRLSPDNSTVTCTSNATSLSLVTVTGALWTTNAADFPFDINVEGERITVTNITGASSPQTATVTRSVNGVVKAHTSAAINLWQPMHLAM